MTGHPLKVRDPLDEVAVGEMLLHDVQRAHVWEGLDVAKVVVSIYGEYPAGREPFRETNERPVTRNLDGVESPALPSSGRPRLHPDRKLRLCSVKKPPSQGDDAAWRELVADAVNELVEKMV